MNYIAIINKDYKKKIVKKISNRKNLILCKKFYYYNNALNWLEKIYLTNNKNYINKNINRIIFCDSGTSYLSTLEVRVLYNEINILQKEFPNYINDRGNLMLDNNFTNNFGELLGLFIALKYAIKYNIKLIGCDSLIVSVYWIYGFFSKTIDNITKILIKKVITLSKIFFLKKGRILTITSSLNKADVKIL